MNRSIACLLALVVTLSPPLGTCLAAERITPAVAMGLVVSRQTPELPAIARQLRLAGAVDVDVTIGETGAVEKAEQLRGNPVLGKAAMACFMKWKFKPYKSGDAAATAVVTLTFDFK